MKNIKKVFGSNMKRVRLERSMSQEELAEKCSLNRTYIGSVERGERNISLVNIDIISQALGIEISILTTKLTSL